MTIVERIWYGRGAAAAVARGALTPLSWLYGAGARANGWNRARHREVPVLPCLSIGNLSVGGTGKTPLAAWAAAAIREKDGRPAIVMRGYGDDEPLVHRCLNPDVPVVVNADRVRGVAEAREAGADCVILDDAFQYQRIARVADWVLIAAEQWHPSCRVLPAGPFREPVDALRRANAVIITRKTAPNDAAADIARQLSEQVDPAIIAQCRFELGSLRSMSGAEVQTIGSVSGLRVLAIAAIGAPHAFFAQLSAAGATVHEASFADHHAFDATDVGRLVQQTARVDAVVCTLKDAVKLAPLWPPIGLPLWYVSQQLVIESGAQVLNHWLEAVLAARQPHSSTA